MSYLKEIKVKDFTLEMLAQICNSLNRGHTIEVKREREGKIVIVDIARNVVSKNITTE
jgi:hypothetical protein